MDARRPPAWAEGALVFDDRVEPGRRPVDTRSIVAHLTTICRISVRVQRFAVPTRYEVERCAKHGVDGNSAPQRFGASCLHAAFAKWTGPRGTAGASLMVMTPVTSSAATVIE